MYFPYILYHMPTFSTFADVGQQPTGSQIKDAARYRLANKEEGCIQ
jgi:hypothetical protein